MEYKRRWPIQYNFYVLDRDWGRLFVRLSRTFPFSARICLNQHHWLARRLAAEGIAFRRASNMFLSCGDPARRQALADALTPRDLERCGQKWLRPLVPFFTPTERRSARTACSRLASLRYDLSKLRAKRLVERVEHTRRPDGYRLCVHFLKLFERVYVPLAAGLLRPVASDARLTDERRQQN